MHAVAVYDWGRWVVNCPNPDCTNALAVQRGHAAWLCRYVNNLGEVFGCQTAAPIDWPDDVAAIEARLASLPESQRHWDPREERKEIEQ